MDVCTDGETGELSGWLRVMNDFMRTSRDF